MINLFRRCAMCITTSALSASCVCDHALFVAGRKNLREAMSVVCTACIYTGTILSDVLLKFKRGMPVVSSITTPLRVLCFEFIVL